MTEKQTSRSRWHLVEAIGKPYAMSIIETLAEGSARFVDLKDACSHDSTLTKRLRELADANLIKTESVTKNKRPHIHYKLTRQGKKTFEAVKTLSSEKQR